MARHILDELECDEIYHALIARKSDLDKRAKDLEEKDGLPEAAQAVRERIAIYLPAGEGKAANPGLLKRFAAQRDITTEATDADREERNKDGQQDAFGGGAETGGGNKAGQVVKGAAKKGAKKTKGDGKAGAAVDAVKEADANAADIPDAEFEVIPESRRLGNGGETPTDGATPPTDPKVLDAVSRLDSISDALKQGPGGISADDYAAEAGRVLELLAAANPAMDADFARNHVMQELASAADGNAHALSYFIDRMTAVLKPEPDMPAPIGAGGLSFAKASSDEPDGRTGAVMTDPVGG